MSNYATLLGALTTTLEGVSGVNQVYNYETAKPEGFPYVILTPADDTDETLDTARNHVEYKFGGKIFAEFNSEDRGTSESEMITLVDTIIDTIKTTDYSSDGAIARARMSGRWGYLETTGGWLRVYEFEVTIRILITVRS